MDPLEVIHLFSLTIGVMFVAAHMNSMTPQNTTKFEICVWWFLGVGYFGEWCFQLYWLARGVPYFIPPEHVLTSVGITGLIVVNARPEWRPLFADRRKTQRPVSKDLRRNA